MAHRDWFRKKILGTENGLQDIPQKAEKASTNGNYYPKSVFCWLCKTAQKLMPRYKGPTLVTFRVAINEKLNDCKN